MVSCVYIYIYVCVCARVRVYTSIWKHIIFTCHIYIYVYIGRERERSKYFLGRYLGYDLGGYFSRSVWIYIVVYIHNTYTDHNMKTHIYVLRWSSSMAWGIHLRTYLPILQQLQKVDNSQVKCRWENWYGEGFELKWASSKQNFILSLLMFGFVLGTSLLFYIGGLILHNPLINGF